MGIIQNGINSAISGTAFMLGITGATQQLRDQNNYKKGSVNVENAYAAAKNAPDADPETVIEAGANRIKHYQQGMSANMPGAAAGFDRAIKDQSLSARAAQAAAIRERNNQAEMEQRARIKEQILALGGSN